MFRLSAAAVLALTPVSLWPSAVGASTLTASNSVLATLLTRDVVAFNGVGCGECHVVDK